MGLSCNIACRCGCLYFLCINQLTISQICFAETTAYLQSVSMTLFLSLDFCAHVCSYMFVYSCVCRRNSVLALQTSMQLILEVTKHYHGEIRQLIEDDKGNY